ncbi:MAG: hypothetical protein ACP6IS_05280 [Candidatus Asgardarchaeia archaeon]
MLPIGIISSSNRTYFLLINELKKRNIPFKVAINKSSLKNVGSIIVSSDLKEELKKLKLDEYRVITISQRATMNEVKIVVTLATYFSRAIITKGSLIETIGIDPGEKRIGLALLINGILAYKTVHYTIDTLIDDLTWIVKGINKRHYAIYIGNGCKKAILKIKEAIKNTLSTAPIFVIDESSSNITNSDADAAIEIAHRGYHKQICTVEQHSDEDG